MHLRILLLVFVTLLHPFFSFQTPSDTLQEQAIHDRLERFNARDYSPFTYRELGRTLDRSRGGVVYLGLYDRGTSERVIDLVEWLVVVPNGSQWAALLPGDFGYTDTLNGLPPDIRARLSDSAYREHVNPTLVSAEALADYVLPWEAGRWATITRSYRGHGRGRIDFDITSQAIAAAKDGVIVYANDSSSANGYSTGSWWHWNVVIIEHGEHEYSLYGHLAPGSLPAWIRESCTTDYSASNCAVPVRAGDVIGSEGTTGYSSSPHLHIEFGQGYGIVGYATSPTTIAYAGYIYAEQNVGFSGYPPNEVASWRYGRLVQAISEPAPYETELVRNASFDDGTGEWSPSGQVSWSVQDGVMRFLRLNTSEPPLWAAFYQDVGYGIRANSLVELRVRLGNASGYDKTISISLYNAAGRDYGELTCSFRVPANTPLGDYSLRGQVRDTWANGRLEFSVNPPDSAAAALVDDVSVIIRDVEGSFRTTCSEP